MSVNITIQLVSVNLSWCEMMTAAGVAALAEGCPLLNTFIAKVNTSLIMDNKSHYVYRAVSTSVTRPSTSWSGGAPDSSLSIFTDVAMSRMTGSWSSRRTVQHSGIKYRY